MTDSAILDSAILAIFFWLGLKWHFKSFKYFKSCVEVRYLSTKAGGNILASEFLSQKDHKSDNTRPQSVMQCFFNLTYSLLTQPEALENRQHNIISVAPSA